MDIAIIGAGYVGLSTAACFAEKKHNIICADRDREKIKQLKNGISPIFEPDLDRLLVNKNISFTHNSKKAIRGAEIVICAVGTPQKGGGRPDISQVEKVAKLIGRYSERGMIFIIKSTVPPGTTKYCIELMHNELDRRNKDFNIDVVFNPEFLKQGEAVKDTQTPDRIILGIERSGESGGLKKKLSLLFGPFAAAKRPIVFTDSVSAEMIKYSANAFLSMKISFINELAQLSEKTGANIRDVARGIGLDSRIGPAFLKAGIGFGGNCLKKDLNALIHTAKKHRQKMHLMEKVRHINENQKNLIIQKLLEKIDTLKDKTVAVWGLTFKPDTDDYRDAPSIEIIKNLKKKGADVNVYDPKATGKFIAEYPHLKLNSFSGPIEAARNADAVLLLTEWDELQNVNFTELASVMNGNVVFDGRNVYDPAVVRSAGLEYIGIGVT